jgi:ABC-type hemin transport system substrate-binding protein
MIGPKNYESTSLNPFDTQETTISKKDSLAISSTEKNSGIKSTVDTNVSGIMPVDSTSIALIPETEKNVIIDSIDKSNVKTEPVIKEATIPQTVTNSIYQNIYVIAGVFKIKENADKMLNSLKQQGFANAQVIETNNRHYVTFENATNREGALAMIDTLHKKNLDSWIWKH